MAALVVLAMGATGIAVATLVGSRLSADSDMRMSNYGSTLAQYTAEGGINALLYYWNTRQVTPPNRPASYPTFAPVVATYSVPGGPPLLATSNGTYSIAVTQTVPGTYSVVAQATVTSASAGTRWQSISRTVTVTVASTSTQYKVMDYRR